MSDVLDALTARIGQVIDQRIRPLFKEGARYTVMVRFTDSDTGDVIVSDDTDEGMRAIVERRTNGHAPPAQEAQPVAYANDMIEASEMLELFAQTEQNAPDGMPWDYKALQIAFRLRHGAQTASHAARRIAELEAERDNIAWAVRFAPTSAHWSEMLKELLGPDAREGIDFLDHQLIEARTRIEALEAERDRLREELETLARLGNGERYGNSVGNMIARAALERES